MIETTTSKLLNFAKLQEQLALVVIVNYGYAGLYLESEEEHNFWYDNFLSKEGGRIQSIPRALDSTYLYRNFKEISYNDRHGQKKVELVSTVEFSTRISNNSQNILLTLDVAHDFSIDYIDKKSDKLEY